MIKKLTFLFLLISISAIAQVKEKNVTDTSFNRNIQSISIPPLSYELLFQKMLIDSAKTYRLGHDYIKCLYFPVKLDGINISGNQFHDLYSSGNINTSQIKFRFIKEYNWLPVPWWLWPNRHIKYRKVTTKYPINYNTATYSGKKAKSQLAKQLNNQNYIVLVDSLQNTLQIANHYTNDSLIYCSMQLLENEGIITLQLNIKNESPDTLFLEAFSSKLYLLDDKFCDIGIINTHEKKMTKCLNENLTIAPNANQNYIINFSGYDLSYKDKVTRKNLFIPYTQAMYVWFNYFKYQVNGNTYYWKYFNKDTGEYLKIEK